MDLPWLLRTIIEHVTRKTWFYGFYRFRVVEQVGDNLVLQVVAPLDGLPDQLSIRKGHGLAGASELCAPGSIVLVGFEGGNPAAAFVAFYLDGRPLNAALDASFGITVGASLAPPLSLRLGGAAGAQPIALATALTAYLTARELWALQVDALPANVAALTAQGPAGPYAAAIAARVAAYAAGMSAAGGWTSIRTRSQ